MGSKRGAWQYAEVSIAKVKAMAMLVSCGCGAAIRKGNGVDGLAMGAWMPCLYKVCEHKTLCSQELLPYSSEHPMAAINLASRLAG